MWPKSCQCLAAATKSSDSLQCFLSVSDAGPSIYIGLVIEALRVDGCWVSDATDCTDLYL